MVHLVVTRGAEVVSHLETSITLKVFLEPPMLVSRFVFVPLGRCVYLSSLLRKYY